MSMASTPLHPSFPINRTTPAPSFPPPASSTTNTPANPPNSARERGKTGGSTSVGDGNGGGGMWNEILSKASRQERKLPRKHVLILGEPKRGKSTLIQNLIKSTPAYRQSQSQQAQYRHGGGGAPSVVATSSFAPFVYPNTAPGGGDGSGLGSGSGVGTERGMLKGDDYWRGSSRITGGRNTERVDGSSVSRNGVGRSAFADSEGLADLMGHSSDEHDSREPVIMDDLLPLPLINNNLSFTHIVKGKTQTQMQAPTTDPTIMESLEPDIGLAFEWVDVNGDMENDSTSSIGGVRDTSGAAGVGAGEVGDIPMVGMWVPGGLGEWKDRPDSDPDRNRHGRTGKVGGVLDLVKASLTGEDLAHTAALIVLDWSKPHTMVPELLRWLAWLEVWYAESDKGVARGGEGEAGVEGKVKVMERDMREKLQSYIQHYVEPKPPASSGTDTAGNAIFVSGGLTSYGGVENLLPLGPGVLTRNQSGIPIVIACTRSDLVDSVGDRLISLGKVAGKGLGGGGSRSGDGRTDPTDWSWDERTDWAQQVLRVVALQYGASLFFLSTAQPHSYPLLRQHVLHRLYTIPPSLTPGSNLDTRSVSQSNRFAFPHRANVLDRDALLLPAGWDTWGKIKALNDTFDTKEMEEMCAERMEQLEDELSGRAIRQQNDGMIDGGEEEDNIELWWEDVMPNPEDADALVPTASTLSVAPSEQSFLTRQLDVLLRDPLRDPRKAFRQGAPSISEWGSGQTSVRRGPLSSHPNGPAVIGPMGSAGMGGQVEMVLNGMANSLGTDRKAGGGQDPMRTPSGKRDPTIPTPKSAADSGLATGASSNDVLNNFFQGLIAGRKTPAGTPKAAGST